MEGDSIKYFNYFDRSHLEKKNPLKTSEALKNSNLPKHHHDDQKFENLF
ncbi:hypothetical protein HNP69_000574 [Chryseobacterium koreense]|nr:hypothetical protein [Chryseobacterium koreense]